ncbi:MAG: hypothetical protein K5776_02260 [Lachnospiraceae bacterium]|nr:hypothetical protein [Lachnospiraceae bacterium]
MHERMRIASSRVAPQEKITCPGIEKFYVGFFDANSSIMIYSACGVCSEEGLFNILTSKK